MDEDKKVSIYARGLVFCSVCVHKDMPIEEVEKIVNEQYPSGIKSKWKKSKENFANGSPNPHGCEDGGNSIHYLLNC